MAVTPGRRPLAAAGFIGVLILGLIAALVWQNAHRSTFDPWDGTYGRIPALSDSPTLSDPVSSDIGSTWYFPGSYSVADADIALVATSPESGTWGQIEAHDLTGGRTLWAKNFRSIPCSLGHPGVLVCARGTSVVSFGLRDGAERRLFDLPAEPDQMVVVGDSLIVETDSRTDAGIDASLAGFDMGGVRRWDQPTIAAGTRDGLTLLQPFGSLVYGTSSPSQGASSDAEGTKSDMVCLDPATGAVLGRSKDSSALPFVAGTHRLVMRGPSGSLQVVSGGRTIDVSAGYAQGVFLHDGSLTGTALVGDKGYEYVADDGTRWSVPGEIPIAVCGGSVVSMPGFMNQQPTDGHLAASRTRIARDGRGAQVWRLELEDQKGSFPVACDGSRVVEASNGGWGPTITFTVYGRGTVQWTSEPLNMGNVQPVRGLGLVMTESGSSKVRVLR